MTTKKKQAELRQRWETIDEAYRKTTYELQRQGIKVNEKFMFLESALRELMKSGDGYSALKFVIDRVRMLERVRDEEDDSD